MPDIHSATPGNELNNEVNLPPSHCGGEHCFDTADMVAYTGRLVDIIKQVDPRRPISSGFSIPRPAAWHMEHCPPSGACEADPGAGFWSVDTEEQWTSMLTLQNSAVDVISVHHCKPTVLSQFVALSVSLTPNASPLQTKAGPSVLRRASSTKALACTERP